MITEFSTYGSCGSRVIFNSTFNKEYKKFFKINKSVEGSNFISLMSKPINVDSDLIQVDDSFSRTCFIDDVSKQFLDFLKKDIIDYLIIDTYFEVILGVYQLSKNQYVSDSSHLQRTKFYDTIKNYKRIDIRTNYEEYIKLWKKSCDNFFEFMDENCEKTKVILNCCKSVYKYYDDDILVEDGNLLLQSVSSNGYRYILDKYILENFDVEVLPFDESTLAYKNHLFEVHSIHYEPKFYKDKTVQLNDIIKRNNSYGYNSSKNIQFRKNQRKKSISRFPWL